jgi:hypothetical protein
LQHLDESRLLRPYGRVVVSGCVTAAVLGALLISLLIMTAAVNRRPGNESLSLALPVLAPAVVLWIVKRVSHGAKAYRAVTITVGSLTGLMVGYGILLLLADSKQTRLAEADELQIAVMALAVFAGTFLATCRKTPTPN